MVNGGVQSIILTQAMKAQLYLLPTNMVDELVKI